MTSGIIIISIGSPLYGRMSLTLAASIRANSDIPIAIIHDNASLKDLSERQRGLFSHEIFVPSDPALSDAENAFKLKTEIYRLSPFEKTLLVDADVILLPGKKADDWFEELKGIPFTACCNGSYDYATGVHSRTDYPYWADVDATRKHFGIADDAKLPQINSSFVSFEKCQQVEELFRIAKNVWEDKTFESGTYRGSKTDEFCFNVACAITKIYPHQIPYRPIFFFFNSEKVDEAYILDNYNALSVICDTPDDRVIDLYNKYMVHFFRKFGFKEPFYYSDKMDKGSRKVIGFWHIALLNNWKEVVQEQLMILVNDGLLEMCDEIVVNIASEADGTWREFEKMVVPYPKIKAKNLSNLSEYEFPALALMKSYSMSQKFFGFYFHTKSVSAPAPNQDQKHKDNWRDLLNHYVLRLWRTCFRKVSGAYDIAGANWLDECAAWQKHFSGNFYWFDSEYIKRLPEVYTLNKKDRYQAEMWLGKKNPKVYCVASHKMDGYVSEWFPQRKIGVFWEIKDDYSGKMNLLRNSGLLTEAHHSVAFTGVGYDLSGFTAVSVAQFEEHLTSYCILNPDAFICLVNENDGVFQWKRCFGILEKGYDSVVKDGKMMWVTASFINYLDSVEDLEKKSHRKFVL